MAKRTKIFPIILGAGSSKNLGKPKALALFGEKTSLGIAVDNCEGLECPIVVLGCNADRVRRKVPKLTRVILNKHWRKGQLSSLLCALKLVPRSAAVLIYPVDHPLLQKPTIHQLVAEFRSRKSPEEIVMPRHRGRFGHPIILSAALRDELFCAKTTREVVYGIPERIRIFETMSSAIYEDFDTPEAYQQCRRKFEARR